jgi:peptidoglycan/xylan/chitin deacetylase (PgdA/CDA1 family)
MWSVIGHDWRWPAERIERLLTKRARNGDIICLHDGRRTERAPDVSATLEAVELAIPQLQERGFRFETVSQILCPTK